MKNRKKAWIAQGSYKSFNTGKPMLMRLDDATGATILEPLHRTSATPWEKETAH